MAEETPLVQPFSFNKKICVTIKMFAKLEGITRKTVHQKIKDGKVTFSSLWDGKTEKKFIHASCLSEKARENLDMEAVRKAI